MNTRHMLPVLVESKPGALMRIATLFMHRAFNIRSLAVGETGDSRISRITVVVNAAKLPIEQVTKQLNKLVDVLKIVRPGPTATIERQLLLVRVSANGSSRANVLQIVDLFRAHVVNVVPDAVTIETAGSDARVEAFLTALEPYGIRGIVQPDTVAITRGARSLSGRVAAELN